MRETRELLEAFSKLRTDVRWHHILADMHHEREARVVELVHGERKTEYERAVTAGRIQALDELLTLADTASERLKTFRTK